MTDIQWEDEAPEDGRGKYVKLLAEIKEVQLSSPERRESWAFLEEFAIESSARDAASRLGKKHDEFEFISRKAEVTTNVYARLKTEVTA